MLRNGDRVTGLFDGYNNNQVYVDVSASDERKIPVGDVALLDFVGGGQGLPETELSQARGDEHVLLLKSGGATKGRLVSVEGTDRDPTLLFRTTSGEERRVRFSEVGRLYLGRYPGAAPARRPVDHDDHHGSCPERPGGGRRQPAVGLERHHGREGPAGQLQLVG